MSPSPPKQIEWKVHLTSSPDTVYGVLSSTTGRESFWAESAPEIEGRIHFEFPNGAKYRGLILEERPTERFAVEYFGGAATFELEPDGQGGTDLTLGHQDHEPAEYHDTAAGWVSVLLSLKAAVDYSVDLRNHDSDRTWDEGYIDN